MFGFLKKKIKYTMTSFIDIKIDDVVLYDDRLITITDLMYKSSDEGYYYHKGRDKKGVIEYITSWNWTTEFKVVKK